MKRRCKPYQEFWDCLAEDGRDRAVKSSKEAFGTWRDRSPEDRRDVLLKVSTTTGQRNNLIVSS